MRMQICEDEKSLELMMAGKWDWMYMFWIVIWEDLGSDGGGTEAQTASARTVGMISQKYLIFI